MKNLILINSLNFLVHCERYMQIFENVQLASLMSHKGDFQF